MERLLGPHSAALHALLRVTAGFLFFEHGLPKLFGYPTANAAAEPFTQFWFAGLIEVFGGLAIALGLFASVVAFIASGEMAVAYFQAHAPRDWWPVVNGGELAALYCFLFLYVAATGSGQWSLDRWRQRGRPAPLL